ncbi:ficolin-2-like [Lineus longissimus]|uniref:ficolin-2-like n=1 Tax=Lineus longissimus TaxID=88925 RepID=UPI00315DB828
MHFRITLTYIFFVLAKGQSSGHFRLVTEKGETLSGLPVAGGAIRVDSLIECCQVCLSNSNCVAVNFQHFPDFVKDRLCVLLSYINAIAGKTENALGFSTFVAVSRATEARFSYCAGLAKGTGVKSVTINGKSVAIPCDNNWLVIQRRKDGSVDFEQDWAAYKQGFGSPSGELWLGNDKIHHLTTLFPCILKVIVTSDNGTEYWAQFSGFSVANEAQSYTMVDAVYDGGTTGDFLTNTALYGYALNLSFSTKDRDRPGHSCAKKYRGGWWYSNCYQANLNGVYGVECNLYNAHCIRIITLQNYGLKIVRVVMKILPIVL